MKKQSSPASAPPDEPGIAKRFDFGNSVLLLRPTDGGAADADALLDGLIDNGVIGGARRDVAADLLKGKVPRPMGPWGLLVRLAGHPWAYLVGDGLRYEWPRDLADTLGLRTAAFFANGLIGRLEAQAFEPGRLLVDFAAGPSEGRRDDDDPAKVLTKELKSGDGIRVRGPLLDADWLAKQRSVEAAWRNVAVALDAFVPLIWHGGRDGTATIDVYGKRKLKKGDIERVDVVTFGPAETLEPTQASRNLSAAIKAGDADAARAALAAGASPNYLPDRDESPLIACLHAHTGSTYSSAYCRMTRGQQLDLLEALLAGGADPDPPGGPTAVGEVMERIEHGDERTHINLLAAFLDHGADVNAFCETTFFGGDRPLSVAAHRRRLAITKFLLERGADPTLPNRNGRTPREQLLKLAAMTCDSADATAGDLLALLRAAEAGEADTADWPTLAEEAYQAYAAATRARRRQIWLDYPDRQRELDAREGGPRYDTLEGDEPPQIVPPPTLHAPNAPAVVTFAPATWLGGMSPQMRDDRKFFLRGGFDLVGQFDIRPLYRARALAFVHPKDHVFAVAYEAAGAEHCELTRYHDDGSSLLVTNLPAPPDRRVERAGRRLVRMPGESAAALLERLRAEVPRAAVTPVPADEFAERFARDYAADFAAQPVARAFSRSAQDGGAA